MSEGQQFFNDRANRKDEAALLGLLEYPQATDNLDPPLCSGFPCFPLAH